MTTTTTTTTMMKMVVMMMVMVMTATTTTAVPQRMQMVSLAYTEESTVTGSIQLLPLMAVGNSFCFFTRISGQFDADQDSCSIIENFGNWELQYSEGFQSSGIACSARCGYLTEISPAAAAAAAAASSSSSRNAPLMPSMLATVNVSQEFISTGQIQEVEMVPTSRGVCAITEVGGAFGSERDTCSVGVIGVGVESWMVTYTANPGPGPGDGHTCGSHCACIDSVCEPAASSSSSSSSSSLSTVLLSALQYNSFNISDEYETGPRQDSVDMGVFEDNFCWLVGFGGNFGSNMACSVHNVSGRWVLQYLDRTGARASITCRARCITRNIL